MVVSPMSHLQLVASHVEDLNQVVTAKSLAYELNIPLKEAQAVLEEYSKQAGSKVRVTWSLVGPTRVILTKDEKLTEDEARIGGLLSKTVFSVEKVGGDSANDMLNSSFDQLRAKVITEEGSDRLLRNTLGSVSYGESKILSHAAKPVFTVQPEVVEPQSKPQASTAKTAVDFFRNPSVSSQSSTGSGGGKKSSSSTTAAKSEAAGGVKSFLSKSAPKPQSVDETTATAKANAADSVSSSVKPTARVEEPAKKSSNAPVFDEEENEEVARDDKEADDSSSDESSSSSDSDLESDEEHEPMQDIKAKPTVKSPTAAPSATKGKRRKGDAVGTGHKVPKKSRVVVSDDEEDDSPEARAKAQARLQKKEQRKAEKAVEKQAEKEAKKRREAEEKEAYKLDFLKQLGAKEQKGEPSTTMKKVLRTKTFIDEDGFEVTEDVLEEVEVIEELPVEPAPPPPVKSASIPKEKKAASAATAAPKSSAGRQASLTSFFTKKAKEN